MINIEHYQLAKNILEFIQLSKYRELLKIKKNSFYKKYKDCSSDFFIDNEWENRKNKPSDFVEMSFFLKG